VIFKFEYLVNLKVECETALGYESGDRKGLILEKSRMENLVRMSFLFSCFDYVLNYLKLMYNVPLETTLCF
jgi:hypothetical protein